MVKFKKICRSIKNALVALCVVSVSNSAWAYAEIAVGNDMGSSGGLSSVEFDCDDEGTPFYINDDWLSPGSQIPASWLPTMPGYTFAGYKDDASDFMWVTADGTLHLSDDMYYNICEVGDNIGWDSQWTATSSYSHTLNVNGGDTASSPSTVYTRQGEGVYREALSYAQSMNSAYKITKLTTLPTKSNNKFKGFYDASSGGTQLVDANGNFKEAAKNSTVSTWYAQWQPLYALTFEDGIGGSGGPGAWYFNSTGVYTDNHGTTVAEFPITAIPTKAGYQFAGYSYNSTNAINSNGGKGDEGFWGYYLIHSASSPQTLTAQWTPNQITITWYGVATAGTGFTSLGNNTYKSEVTYGGDIITPAAAVVANAGQTFLGWKFENPNNQN